jgi:hypothetical protein
MEDRFMRNHRKAVFGAALALVVSGTLWAGSARPSLPLIKSAQVKAATSNVSQTIIDNIDEYQSGSAEDRYHAKIQDPNVSWQEKCQLAIAHRRLELLSSDLGGNLGGTREVGRSILRVRLFCPEPVAVFDIPANFEVHTAPHPEELREMSFDTHMHSIEGQGTNVGPFAAFRLVGGTANGYESPGRTSLIPEGDGNFAIDSTFNIGYRIDYVGAPGGPLDGASGTYQSTILMKAVGK